MSSPSTFVYFNLWCNWVTKRILIGQKPIESLAPVNFDLHHSLSRAVSWMSGEDKPWSLNLIFPLNLLQLIRMLEIRTEISYCLIMAGWKCLRKINLNLTLRTSNWGWQLSCRSPVVMQATNQKLYFIPLSQGLSALTRWLKSPSCCF